VKQVALVALVLLVGAVAAGCGSPVATTAPKTTPRAVTPKTTPRAVTPKTTPRAVTPKTTPSSTSAPTTAPTAPATTVAPAEAACQNDQIRVVALGYGEAAGSVAETLGFVNVSGRSCSLGGYPGVAGLDAEGQQVIQATRETSSMLGGLQNGSKNLPVVSLAPG